MILATHSPTIIDAADQDDIFLIRPAELIDYGENQALPLGREPNRLSEIQEVIGSVFPITAARPILFVEGSDRVSVRNYSDKQIYTFLDPRFLKFNMMSGNGKEECLKALKSARKTLQGHPFDLKIFALLDRDFDESDMSHEGAYQLPVCMIENLLLSPAALQAGFGSLLHLTIFNDESSIKDAISTCIMNIKSEEIGRRFRRKLRLDTLGFSKDISDASQARLFVEQFSNRISQIDFLSIEKAASEQVEIAISNGNAVDIFSGKLILGEFFKRHVEGIGITKAMFTYNAARQAASDPKVRDFLDSFFEETLG